MKRRQFEIGDLVSVKQNKFGRSNVPRRGIVQTRSDLVAMHSRHPNVSPKFCFKYSVLFSDGKTRIIVDGQDGFTISLYNYS